MLSPHFYGMNIYDPGYPGKVPGWKIPAASRPPVDGSPVCASLTFPRSEAVGNKPVVLDDYRWL